jgi:hypothetical protein
MQILDLGYQYGTTSTYSFSTTVTQQYTGVEKRTANWINAKAKYQIGNKSLSQTELDLLIAFHTSTKGAKEVFLFKDYADYIALNAPVTNPLTKTYTFGSSSYQRPITRPNVDTQSINNGKTSFEFWVPVRFEKDSIDFTLEGVDPSSNERIYTLQNVTLLEVREQPLTYPPSPALPELINTQFNLGYDLGSIFSPFFNTRILTTSSGYEKRISEWTTPLIKYSIGSRSFTNTELNYLLSAFRVCRGRAIKFLYPDKARKKVYKVRFDVDEISVRFDAFDIHTKEAIFTVSGINLYGEEA